MLKLNLVDDTVWLTQAQMTELFQTTKQNALGRSWGHTAAEIIAEQANAKETHMGLTSFSGKKSKRADVSIAKNYLTAEELDMVN